MRFLTSLMVLAGAAASVSARPVPHPHVADVFPRELQYSDIAALEGATPDYWQQGAKESHSGEGRDGYYPNGYDYWHRDNHHDHHFDERHPHPHPRDHHHGSPRGDIIDNIMGFLSREARLVPDVSSRVVQGMVDFLSHETRAEHLHHHMHEREDPMASHPKTKVIDNILDFLASTVKR